MAQKPLLWVEVGAHAMSNRSKCGGVGWAGAGAAWRLGVCVLFLRPLGLSGAVSFLCVVLPRRGLRAKHR